MNRSWIVYAALLVLLGALGGAGLAIMLGLGGEQTLSGSESSPGNEPRILYWVAPMDPGYRRDEPGLSPMGMELIPVYEDGDSADDGTYVRINPSVINNIGVRTARVHRQAFTQTVNAVGYVRLVDELTSVVDVRSEGWIERLPVAAVGDEVEAGSLLFSLYAPGIATAQSEYLQAVRTGRQAMIDASVARLQALGMTRGQVQALARRGTAAALTGVIAPQAGIVTELSVREGAFVRPGDPVMTISDLSEIWVITDVFEDRIAQIEPGNVVRISTSAQPGREWTGQVEYIYPAVDPQSRTIPVRIRLENADLGLRPGAYVNAVIEADPRTNVLMVPREAVIRTGQSERVIIYDGDGRFRPARIVTGGESGGMVEILSGLGEGELVVVSSQFLIDSEASLQGVMLRMSPPGEIGGSGHQTDPSLASVPVEGTGIVDSLMAGHGMIDITHDPIAALSWPAMTMSFLTIEGLSLDGITAGDRVQFSLIEDGGNWRISAIDSLESHQGDPDDGGGPDEGEPQPGSASDDGEDQ